MLKKTTLLAATCLAFSAFGQLIPPNCPNPAPYVAAPAGACVGDEQIVLLRNGNNATTVTPQIESACGFTGSQIFTSLPAFVARVTPAQLACIRCDPRVLQVEQDYVIGGPDAQPTCGPAAIPTLGEVGTFVLAATLSLAGLFLITRRGL
jgi:hypothetical protein